MNAADFPDLHPMQVAYYMEAAGLQGTAAQVRADYLGAEKRSGPEVLPCFNCSGVGRVPVRSDGSMGDMNCRVCSNV